jgi:hypothetical protein
MSAGQRVTDIKDLRCPGQQSSGGCPVQGKRINPVELSEITLHDVDIVEVWGGEA